MTASWLLAAESEFADRLANDRLAHALLLHGPADCGKVALAEQIMASVLCLENTYPACGKCRSCQLMAGGAHPDGHRVTFEEHPRTGNLRQELVIEQVRRLSSALFLTTTFSPRKAALIYPVEAMNTHTANALLKTLEEPPGDTVMILVSHDTARLPATIRSRCQALAVRLPARQEALKWLQAESDASRHEAELALNAGGGSPLRALRMLQDGGTDQFLQLKQWLDRLATGQAQPGAALGGLQEVDTDRLWPWISLHAAEVAKRLSAQGDEVKSVLSLQQQADRNRRLTATPVRKDLLLQDWLIQWARLSA